MFRALIPSKQADVTQPIEATFTKIVLEVSLPKAPSARAKATIIEIKPAR